MPIQWETILLSYIQDAKSPLICCDLKNVHAELDPGYNFELPSEDVLAHPILLYYQSYIFSSLGLLSLQANTGNFLEILFDWKRKHI